jgi:hypothetical protein
LIKTAFDINEKLKGFEGAFECDEHSMYYANDEVFGFLYFPSTFFLKK